MNGYPEHVIEKTYARKLKDFTSPTSHAMKKCLVYLHLPWLGTPSVRLENKIKVNVEKCFFAVEQCVIYTSRPLLSAIKKDVLPALLLSNVECICRLRPKTMSNNKDLEYMELRAYPMARKAGQAMIFNNEKFKTLNTVQKIKCSNVILHI